jgi:uncharacterized protein YbjT (DUF2867 family)
MYTPYKPPPKHPIPTNTTLSAPRTTMPSPELVVILGSTGTIGQHLIPSLVTILTKTNISGHILRLVTRDKLKAEDMFRDIKSDAVTLEAVEGTVEDLTSLSPILEGATRLFLLTLTSLGPRQCSVERGVLKLLNLDGANENAPGRFIKHIVRLSAHCSGMEGQPTNSPFRWHSDCDESLIRHCDRYGDNPCKRDVDVTVLRPSLFMQDFARRHFAPVIKEKDTFYQLGSAGRAEGEWNDSYRIAQVDARDIADVAALALGEPVEKHANNTYYLTGPEALNWQDVADAISTVTNRTIYPTLVGDAEFKKLFGDSSVYLKQMQAYRARGQENVEGDYEVVTGRKARSILDYVKWEQAGTWG